MTDVSYGSLMRDAAAQIETGIVGLIRAPFPDPTVARTSLDDYLHLLGTLGRHLYTLTGPTTKFQRAVEGENPSDTAVAARGLAADLSRAPTVVAVDVDLGSDGSRPFAAAARYAGVASDLIALLTDQDHERGVNGTGGVATPWHRGAALVHTAQLVRTLIEAEDTVALRCAEADVPWKRQGPGAPITPAARERAILLADMPTAEQPGAFDAVRLPRRASHTSDPATELTDRLQALRQIAWSLVRAPDHSVTTLRELVLVGLMVHAHIAAGSGADIKQPDAAAPTSAKPLLATVRRWQQLHTDLSAYRTAAPGNSQVHASAVVIRHLLADLAPLAPSRPGALPPRTLAALTEAARVATGIARHTAAAFVELASRSEIPMVNGSDGVERRSAHASGAPVDRAASPAPDDPLARTQRRFAAVLGSTRHAATAPTAESAITLALAATGQGPVLGI